MKNLIYTLILFLFISGCSKMQEKKTSEDSKPPVQTPNAPKTDNPGQTDNSNKSGNNNQSELKSSGQTDEKATELTKYADDAIAKYASDKSNNNKKEIIEKCMKAANYLEFEADLPAKEKYRPALKYYRKVLEVDPKNEEALKNKKEIEDIYRQMGMPIPQ